MLPLKCPRCGLPLKYQGHKELQENFPKAWEPWKPEDDRELEALVAVGTSILNMAEAFGRQPGAIRKRIEKLGLEYHPTPLVQEDTPASEPAPVPDDTRPL
jgi:hypothetical protein